MAQLFENAEPSRPVRKRVPKDPTPRFQPDCTHQIDALLGCLEEQVPADHLSREVWSVVAELDTSELEAQYSALGRRGYHPKRLLAVWVYASLIGLHHSTKVVRAFETDAAFRWLCGGGCPSGPTLRRFRQKKEKFFTTAIEQTVTAGFEDGLVDLDALAVDSLRLRAHASKDAVRTKARSSRRLKELAAVDVEELSAEEREKHAEKVQKHEEAVAVCEERGVASYVTTNELAALMKFPSGANAPGHRTTVVASGASTRFVVGVLVDADPTDHGKLKGALEHTRDSLRRSRVNQDDRISVTADAGYFSDADLQFAQEAQDWADVLIKEAPASGKFKDLFSRDRFTIHDDNTAFCPAGTKMLGPYPNNKEHTEFKWEGVGCGKCALKPQCTRGKFRSISLNPGKERARQAMRDRMAQPGAIERYNKRIATVEPVFSFLEETMGFRRATSRHKETVVSEVFLKILAYNIDRLIRANQAAKRLLCVFYLVIIEPYNTRSGAQCSRFAYTSQNTHPVAGAA